MAKEDFFKVHCGFIECAMAKTDQGGRSSKRGW